MSKQKLTKQTKRIRRKNKIRAKIFSIANRPRLVVFRSLSEVYAQIIDDAKSKTVVGIHSKKIDKKQPAGERKGKIAESFLVGKELATKAVEKGIKKVVFDRAGYRYHGRVKALAEGAREGGLDF